MSSPETVAIASIPILNVATNPTLRTGVVYVPVMYVPGEGDTDGEMLGEGLAEAEELGLFEAEGLTEGEGLGDELELGLALAEWLGEWLGEGDALGLGLADAEWLGEWLEEGLALGETLGLLLGLMDGEGLALGETLGLIEADGPDSKARLSPLFTNPTFVPAHVVCSEYSSTRFVKGTLSTVKMAWVGFSE